MDEAGFDSDKGWVETEMRTESISELNGAEWEASEREKVIPSRLLSPVTVVELDETPSRRSTVLNPNPLIGVELDEMSPKSATRRCVEETDPKQ